MLAKFKADYKAFRISPNDTNKMIILFDPIQDAATFICIIEVFDVGGRTPPNKHDYAQEMFYVLSGQGRAHAGDLALDFSVGDCFLVPPGGWHEVENTGTDKLYCLTFMTPNEGFAELILAGTPDEIDDEDWAVIARAKTPAPLPA